MSRKRLQFEPRRADEAFFMTKPSRNIQMKSQRKRRCDVTIEIRSKAGELN